MNATGDFPHTSRINAPTSENYAPQHLSLPPITLWEQRAALASLHAQGDRAPTQATIFKAVNEQRALVKEASGKTRAARRQAQRQKDSESATMDRTRRAGEAIDYSKPVVPADSELWDT